MVDSSSAAQSSSSHSRANSSQLRVASPRLWADVGGTFTDCFLTMGDTRLTAKVLSSGVIRGELEAVLADETLQICWNDSVPDQFWQTATLRLIDQGRAIFEARVVSQIGYCLKVDRPVPRNLTMPLLVELDAGLESPVLAAHLLLNIPVHRPLPKLDVRLGTTRGTNALLTRRGVKVGLMVTQGFGDCLRIGEQNRPDLFTLEIEKPEPLTEHVLEIDERLTAGGQVLKPLVLDALDESLRQWQQAGVEAIAICLLHAFVNPVHEQQLAEYVEQFGFEQVSVSHRVAPMIKLVSRAETTVLDAYLTPVVAAYVQRLKRQFDRGGVQSSLRLMTSAGNLVDASLFRGVDSILSGPAGGVIALSKLSDREQRGLIGLDMGGTSTDVCRYAGRIPRDYESQKAGVRVLAPMMSIHTVAAGGGSICDVIAGRMTVGPQSAGSMPGPACYGRGGPLTVTDLNVVLGRLPAEHFPFPLDIEAAKGRLREVNAKLGERQFDTLEAAAEGFLAIAVTHMAEAVRTVSTAQGSDPRDFTLVGFGGAAGGHLCAIAAALSMTTALDHRSASLLSALGIGLADVGRIRVVPCYEPLAEVSERRFDQLCQSAQQQAIEALQQEQAFTLHPSSTYQVRTEVDARYLGTESTLTLDAYPWHSLAQRFHDLHEQTFGFVQHGKPIELAVVRAEATYASQEPLDQPETAASQSLPDGQPIDHRPLFHGGRWHQAPWYRRDGLIAEQTIIGPAIVFSEYSTLVIEPGWQAQMSADHSLCVTPTVQQLASLRSGDDPVTLEVVARRMQGIADAMGETLRRTAVSVNIRQRLDFSCAVFDRHGQLIANAPHVPVHLGAMGHTVRTLMTRYPQMFPGDAYVSNHPFSGGSHLPDVTLVSPVFLKSDQSTPSFFVASRAHHAEIGGKRPGSMPPDATSLGEEGVVIDAWALRRQGIDQRDVLRAHLSSGRYPSRDPETNLADINAQYAAGVQGARSLQQMIDSLGLDQVQQCVERLFDQAEQLVAKWIKTLPNHALTFTDSLDDGTKICVMLQRQGERLRIDYAGTSPQHPRCFNATPAIVSAATIYVLRCVIGGTLPMNDGILRRIDLLIPQGLLNPVAGRDPFESPAVVAGNVETSMRVVDCLLGTLGLVAASQGTMNNVLIGDTSFGYYETIGGGAGAGPQHAGASGVHTHMTNTRITDPEVYESRYPVRLWRFALRTGSGGAGHHPGGAGLVRELEFLKPLSLSLITNRRGSHRPWGLAGGEPGQAGRNQWIRADGEVVELAASASLEVLPGERLRIMTPGGGGFGKGGVT